MKKALILLIAAAFLASVSVSAFAGGTGEQPTKKLKFAYVCKW